MTRVAVDKAVDPLLLALDIGSTATRGDVYDATGQPVKGGRLKVPHHFTGRSDGTSEIDPDAVVEEVAQVIAGFAVRPEAARIAGVALDTFASSLVGVESDQRARTPCYTYADSRCGEQVLQLRRELDERQVQQRTGCRLHSSYLAPRLRWLRDTAPETFRAVDRWMSLGEYVYLQLLGEAAAGTSTAAWTGMLDRRSSEWDPEMLAAAGISPEQLSQVRHPDDPLRDVVPRIDASWPNHSRVAWFPPVADGFSSNIGVGASDDSTIAVSVATSGAMRVLVNTVPETMPPGLWCYRVDRTHSLIGGALNDVGRAISWLTATLQLSPEADLDDLLLAPPQPVPMVLPFFTGERSTGWAADARVVISGVAAGTTPETLFRGTMEGVGVSYARIAEQLSAIAGETSQVVASGRVTQDLPGWLQVLADVLQTPVVPVTMKRATLRGTALVALNVLAPDHAKGAPIVGEVRQPVEDRGRYYADRQQEFQRLYSSVIADSATD